MRISEILVFVFALPASFVLLTGSDRRLRAIRICCGLALAALLVHACLLRLYWQIAPAYLGTLLIAFSIFSPRRWSLTALRFAGAAGLVLLLGSMTCLIVLPLFHLPKPTGPYSVGTCIFHLVDPSRRDASFPSGHRELMVQMWYPTQAHKGQLANYRRSKETTLLSSYDAVLKTHSRLNAPIVRAASSFPVLLFNPGWGGQRTQNTFQMEDLASHGFVVAAIDHTHNSMPVAFPSGQVLGSSEPRAIDDFTGMTLDQSIAFGVAELNTETEDDIVALNFLSGKTQDRRDPWFGLLDTNRTGAFGHSFGGAVAIEACFRDPRILSALNMDGTMFGQIQHGPLNKPLMVMYDSDWPFIQKDVEGERHSTYIGDELDMRDLASLQRSFEASGGYLLGISGTKHMNFTDRSLYSPFKSLTDSGTIDPAYAHSIINQYTLAFFSHTLRGTAEPLLNGTPPFRNVDFRAWPLKTFR